MYKIKSMKGENDKLKQVNKALLKEIKQLKANLAEMENCANSWMIEYTNLKSKYEPETLIPNQAVVSWVPHVKSVTELDDKFCLPIFDRETGTTINYYGPQVNDVRYVEEENTSFVLKPEGWVTLDMYCTAGEKDA